MTNEFTRGDSLGWLVAVVASSMAKDLDTELKAKDLSLKLWPTLMCLWERDGVTQAELGRMVGVAGYATTRVLDKLEGLGLVERRDDPSSRRNHNIHLTTRGRRLKRSLTPLAQKVNESHLQLLDSKERGTLVKALQKIVKGLDVT